MNVLRRLLLPLILLVVCVACLWFANRLGSDQTEVATAPPSAEPDIAVVSARRAPDAMAARANRASVTAAFPAPGPEVTDLACATVMVDGVVVHEVNPQRSLTPGFALLAPTVHTALDQLGADHRFVTEFLVENPPSDDGRLIGNLWLVGGGDPAFMSYNHARSFRPVLLSHTDPADLAAAAFDAGLRVVEGSVVGVDRRYDEQRYGIGWPTAYIDQGLVGPMSSLQLNDALINRAAASGDGLAEPSELPAEHAASLIDDELEALEVQITGLARAAPRDEALPSLVPFARVESPPLSELAFQTLAVNDAGAAELLLKEVGLQARSTGSTRSGAETLVETLDELGHPMAEAPRDASGLDPTTTVECGTLAGFIGAVPDGHPTLDVLPAYGVPGVLDGRLSVVETELDLRMVGGVVGRASGVVGRTVGDGPTVSIAVVVNRLGGPSDADLAWQIAMVEAFEGALGTVTADDLAPVGAP